MNCISWMVGHMAVQEQYYFVFFPQGEVPHPYLNKVAGYGHPASTPALDEMWQAWHDITKATEAYMDNLTEEDLQPHLTRDTGSGENGYEAALFGNLSEKALEKGVIRSWENVGTMLLRTTYHYFFHTGEAHAIRQQLGHPDLPWFVGNMEAAFYESVGVPS
jgi:hypothetical protein